MTGNLHPGGAGPSPYGYTPGGGGGLPAHASPLPGAPYAGTPAAAGDADQLRRSLSNLYFHDIPPDQMGGPPPGAMPQVPPYQQEYFHNCKYNVQGRNGRTTG